ncbi:hypothetical protein COOONC_23596 [Cooperia oncophora]
MCTQIPDTTDRVRVQALQGHNYRRYVGFSLYNGPTTFNAKVRTGSRLAQGLVTKNNGNNLPQGANIRRLQYQCDLESSARQSAMRCDTSTWPMLPAGVQENIMVFSKSRAQYRKDAILVMAWASTYEIGCFVHPCSGNRWSAVCHYSPGSHISESRIFFLSCNRVFSNSEAILSKTRSTTPAHRARSVPLEPSAMGINFVLACEWGTLQEYSEILYSLRSLRYISCYLVYKSV